ncbi:hypothetical protein G6O69_29755 [Pseudenhygromyxa sp. WMMC2535]|uniref:hypothetical protein n=1 Tax=Pseudenhygromyxa sp. WMMC2535 TaxID=2712867 RepID=UPI0015569F28|nr:hypothetical protein [Pseudenhygromyxa sp. WMMC2535]NVB42048.1 hypothetical protein [Pseudenhygromyxa sp. WMMC2535]
MMMDGDGILSAINPALCRALKIIQEEKLAKHGYVTWWTQEWSSEQSSATMLVLSIVPSPSSLFFAAELMQAWVVGQPIEASGHQQWNS